MSAPTEERNGVVLPAVAFALLAAGVAWYEVRATRAIEVEAGAIRQESGTAERDARGLEEKLDAMERTRAGIVATRIKAKAAETTAKAGGSAEELALKPNRSMGDPERTAMRLKNFRASLMFEQLSFYRAAGLNEKQIAALEDLMVEHEARRLDLAAVAREKGLPMSDPAIATLRRQEDESYQDELKKQLGDDGARQLGEFQAVAAERRAVGQLAGMLSLTSEPLTAEQGRKLVALFRDQGFRDRRTDPEMWSGLVARAGEFLGTRQVMELRAQAAAAQRENSFNELSKFIEQTKNSQHDRLPAEPLH